jgi:HD superfamily phosphohydrolase
MASEVLRTALREIDVTEFGPIVRDPAFQRTGEKSQLSFVDRVYLGGRHSRLEHMAFVYHFTDELCNHLVRMGFLSEEEARYVKASSLVHDVRQPPFSHATDDLLKNLYPGDYKDHHTMAAETLRGPMANTLEGLGLDVEEVVRIVLKQDPRSKIISHNTLGTDKVGYLVLDTHHTGYRYFQVEDIQKAIQDMYFAVYMHKSVLQYSRFIQKALEEAIKTGEIDTDSVWDMPENALIYILSNSSNPRIKSQISRYGTIAPEYPAFNIRARDDEKYLTLPRPELEIICEALENPITLSEFEMAFEKQFGLEEGSSYATNSAQLRRVMPEDVDLYRGDEKKGTLYELYEGHFANLNERAGKFLGVRIYSESQRLPPKDAVREFMTDYFDI